MNSNDLSGQVDGIMRVYKFTKTSFFGKEESRVYIPVLTIQVREGDSITYRHFSINKNGDVWEDPSRRVKFLAEYPPRKEWMYYLYNFPQDADARLHLWGKFVEFKNNYDDTSFTLVGTIKLQFKENADIK